MERIKLTDRVSIDSLVSWDIGFRATEANRDITIPANVKGYKQLTVGEIDGQVKMGNKFFTGTDGLGNNADIKINDERVIKIVFGDNQSGEEPPSATLLTADSVRELLETSPKAKFQETLEKLVVTDSERKMIISVAKEVGIDNVEAYKISAIEKISGYKFD